MPQRDGMIGAVLSDFVLVSAVALGLGALLATSEFWFSAVKWVGVAYLAYLGMRLLRSKGAIAIAMLRLSAKLNMTIRCLTMTANVDHNGTKINHTLKLIRPMTLPRNSSGVIPAKTNWK